MAEPGGIEQMFLMGGEFAASFRESDTQVYGKYHEVSILNPADRTAWFVLNMNKFLRGRAGGPESWNATLQKWLGNLDSAVETTVATNHNIESETSPLRESTISAMAVSASARAMEASGGSAKDYLTYYARGDQGVQDRWNDTIIHDHPERINMLLEPGGGVDGYFHGVLLDAGIVHYTPWRNKTQSAFVLQRNILDKLENDQLPLVEFLKASGKRFDRYIKSTMTHKDSPADFVLARLACDVFMIDVYTRWLFELQEKVNALPSGNRKDSLSKKIESIKPTDNWGGDPLITLLQPSFLPRVKSVHTGSSKALLDMMDSAFRPVDAVAQLKSQLVTESASPEEIEKAQLLPASMAINLKSFMRYTQAVDEMIGTPRAASLEDFSTKSAESLNKMLELLDQVYGNLKVVRVSGEVDKVGKELVGLIIARIILCKSVAAVATTADPSLTKALGIVFEEEGKGRSPRPFDEARKMLWGPDLDGREGLLTNWTSPRVGLKFNPKSNRFDAKKYLSKSWELLNTNAGNKNTRTTMKAASVISIGMDAIEAINNAFFKGRG